MFHPISSPGVSGQTKTKPFPARSAQSACRVKPAFDGYYECQAAETKDCLNALRSGDVVYCLHHNRAAMTGRTRHTA